MKKTMILVGRGNTGCYGELNHETLENKAKKFEIQENKFQVTMYNMVANMINTAIQSQINVTMYVTESAALKAAQVFAKCGKGANIDNKNFLSPLALQDEELQQATYNLCDAVKAAVKYRIEKGGHVEIKSVSMFDKAELIIPNGVEVQRGQELTFVNGSTANGITLRGWGKNFNRNKIVVESRPSGSKEIFFVTIGSRSKIDSNIRAIITSMWKQCPQVDHTANFQLNLVA